MAEHDVRRWIIDDLRSKAGGLGRRPAIGEEARDYKDTVKHIERCESEPIMFAADHDRLVAEKAARIAELERERDEAQAEVVRLREASQSALSWAEAGGPADWSLIVVWRDRLRDALAATTPAPQPAPRPVPPQRRDLNDPPPPPECESRKASDSQLSYRQVVAVGLGAVVQVE